MERKAGSVRIAVLSGDKQEQEAIAEAIGASEADIIFAPTMHRLRDVLFEKPCNGLLLCVSSLVGLDHSAKSFVQTLEQVYPAARIRWDKAKGSFGLFATRIRRVDSLSDFVTICSDFDSRCLRRSERLSKTLNVLISSTPDIADPARAVTMNISVRGCFLHTPRDWKVGDSVYMQILELPGKHVIEGRVIRFVPWGVPFSAQGIGVQFVNMENEQAEEIQRLLFYLPAVRSDKTSS
jgi:Tfp pilus assembly protein PilZ